MTIVLLFEALTTSCKMLLCAAELAGTRGSFDPRCEELSAPYCTRLRSTALPGAEGVAPGGGNPRLKFRARTVPAGCLLLLGCVGGVQHLRRHSLNKSSSAKGFSGHEGDLTSSRIVQRRRTSDAGAREARNDVAGPTFVAPARGPLKCTESAATDIGRLVCARLRRVANDKK